MKVSEIWLREWVNPTMDAQNLAALLTMAGLEVDAINPVAAAFTGVVVAQVVNCQPHPQADKLTLCEVNVGNGSNLKVVCGANNVCRGLKVALATIGANLPNDLIIKETKLRGELSQGMLCSAAELSLADNSEGIIELDENAPIGMDLREYLLLDDQIFDIDLTPNRADCLSIRGIAREVSAITETKLTTPERISTSPSIDDRKKIHLHANQECSYYAGRIISGINKEAKTPVWMKERLRRSGVRLINPVVDVTNYVMLELGQPMHAFDLQQIEGDITVRWSHEGEKLTLLDGQTITFPKNILLITDDNEPLAMAGVMGGIKSAVNDNTTEVFLESAYFNPLSIAGVARRFGLHTDSSQRYERGVDPSLQKLAIERATALIIEIAGGHIGPIVEEYSSYHVTKKPAIQFDPDKVKKLTGIEIDKAKILTMLEALEMEIDSNQLPWRIIPPLHRFDIALDVDLIEEIIRLFGYNNIPEDEMNAPIQSGKIAPTELLPSKLNPFFVARSYHEAISYSFVDPALQETLYPNKETLTLLNPISSELSQMRLGMWPGLIASMIYNIHRQQTALKFFEHGVIFEIEAGALTEHPCIAGLVTGDKGALNWAESTRKFDFYDVKGDLQALFNQFQLDSVEFVKAEHPALHPGKSAMILLDEQPVGWCGVLHPRIDDALGLSNEVILFELKLNAFFNKKVPAYRPISKYPQIRRDLSLLVDKKTTVREIESTIKQVINSGWLKSFEVFDVYTGPGIPENKKSLAISFTLQDNNRTLIDNEINEIINAIIKKLDHDFAITLRD